METIKFLITWLRQLAQRLTSLVLWSMVCRTTLPPKRTSVKMNLIFTIYHYVSSGKTHFTLIQQRSCWLKGTQWLCAGTCERPQWQWNAVVAVTSLPWSACCSSSFQVAQSVACRPACWHTEGWQIWRWRKLQTDIAVWQYVGLILKIRSDLL